MGWSRFFRRRYWDLERARELDDYLAHEIEDNLARGMTPDAAARAARLKLGNPAMIREEIYAFNTVTWLESVWQDLRHGMRVLRKSPTFAVVAILTLALGAGANAAIFQLVDAVRFRPLPVERPHELVSLGIDTHGKGRVGRRYRAPSVFSEPLWREIRVRQVPFDRLFAWGGEQWDVSPEGESRRVQGLYVSGSFFGALGVRAHAGRLLTEADDRTGCGTPGAVLSHDFWQAQYAGDPGVIGRPITIERQVLDIIGIAPPGFFGVEVGRRFDVAIPLCAEPLVRGAQQAGTDRADVSWLNIMGRLGSGRTLASAEAHLAAMSPAVFQATMPPSYNPDVARDYAAFTLTARSAPTGLSELRTTYATELWVLLAATGLVLLLTCANLANVMLARASARDSEIAVRLAIGGSRGRIVRQVLSESLLIAAFGACTGLLLARWLSGALIAFLSSEYDPLFVPLSPDWRVVAFLGLVSVLACLLFGLSPALGATRTDPGKVLHIVARGSTDPGRGLALRRSLVVLQIAVSTVLVVGALLFGRSLQKLHAVEPGFDPDVLVAYVDFHRFAVPADARAETLTTLVDRIRALPGVRHAAEALIAPLSGTDWNGRLFVSGALQNEAARFNRVGGEYFRTLGTPLIAGRTFDARDRAGAPMTAVVNVTFAERYFRERTPIGRTFQMEVPAGAPSPTYEIVGIVGDTKYLELRERPLPIAYLAMAQDEDVWPYAAVLVKSDLPLASMSPALTRTITQVVPGASISYDTLGEYIGLWLATDRLMASLSGFFGVLALMIAAIGLYGVMSYTVTSRNVEIGIRMALGAEAGAVLRMVLAESGVLLLVGVAAGLILAGFSMRFTSALLYGLPPIDPASFALAAGVLAAASVIAAWIPARRAAALEPLAILRE